VKDKRPHNTGSFRPEKRVKGIVWYGQVRIKQADGKTKQVERVLRNIDGSYAQTSGEKEASIRRLRSELEDAVAQQEVSPKVDTSITLREAGERYLGQLDALKRATMQDYWIYLRRHLTGPQSETRRGTRPIKSPPFFADRTLVSITRADVYAYIAQKSSEGLKPRTLEGHLTLLSAVYRFARDEGWATGNPVPPRRKWPRPDDPDEIEEDPHDAHSSEELHAVLRSCENEFDRTLFMTAYYTGMRLGELQALMWPEVQFGRAKHGLIVVKRSWSRGAQTTPKSRKTRELPMTLTLAQALARLEQTPSLAALDDRVFAQQETGKVLDEGWIRKRFLEAQERAGVHIIRLHDTRSTYATLLWSSGNSSLASVQAKLGHADPRTTMGYIKGYYEQGDESVVIEQALGNPSFDEVAA
jgi:integrase